ncbi:MAG: hypothetical protein A3G38_01910 [Omnitrophica WOR_2 bacterium RIFCSPLOWO2_12_FULL_51_8]|nr:MAG: hypothetical protein A3G38_01910 [Omnitrophica WOR_2 bacterium RIFCSPLOWO2_12_FULL_51_8]
MRKIIFFICIITSCILQAAFPAPLKIFGTKPDLLLICAISACFIFGQGWALFFSLTSGLLKDILGPGPVYSNILLFPLWGLLIIGFSRKVCLDYDPARMGAVFVAAVLQNIFCGSSLIFQGKGIPPGIFLRIALVSSLYTALAWPPVFKFIQSVSYRPPAQRETSIQDEVSIQDD